MRVSVKEAAARIRHLSQSPALQRFSKGRESKAERASERGKGSSRAPANLVAILLRAALVKVSAMARLGVGCFGCGVCLFCNLHLQRGNDKPARSRGNLCSLNNRASLFCSGRGPMCFCDPLSHVLLNNTRCTNSLYVNCFPSTSF